MSIWDRASAVIDKTFRDEEQIIYTGAGHSAAPLWAIRSEFQAPDSTGPGNSLRTIIYEIEQASFPTIPPSKSDTFKHRGHLWRVTERRPRDDIGKWELVVTDGGAVAP